MGVSPTTLACSCFTCCCQECAEGCRRMLGMEKVTKISYIMLILAFTIPSILLFFLLSKWQSFTSYFSAYIKCPQSSGSDRYSSAYLSFGCIGQSFVFRLSLALLLLFVLMLLITLCRNRLAMVINEGCFCAKYLLVLGLVVAFLWVSNQFFLNFG